VTSAPASAASTWYLKDDDFSLLEAMEGTDEYGAVNQADPALALRLPSDPALTAAERRQATEMMRMCACTAAATRNRVLASYVICHLLDENLRTMVKAAHPTDGYAAAQMVRAHCYREPNNITILQMNRTWAHRPSTSPSSTRGPTAPMLSLRGRATSGSTGTMPRPRSTRLTSKLLGCSFSPPPALSLAPGGLPSGASSTSSGTSSSRKPRTWGIPSGPSSGASLLGAPKSRSRSCVPTRRWSYLALASRALSASARLTRNPPTSPILPLIAIPSKFLTIDDRRNLAHSRSLCVARRGV